MHNEEAGSIQNSTSKKPWWIVENNWFSAIYWASLFLMIGGLFRTRIVPFVDYPQHLALAATLRRMLSSAAPERALFETNLLSFNSLFHVLVAGFNFLVPIDEAGKIVLALYILLMGYAVVALLRATRRPSTRAFLMISVIMGYSIAWGFVNFCLGLAIQIVVLARVLERINTTHHTNSSTQNIWQRDLLTLALAWVGAYAHLLATALIYMLILVAIVTDVQTRVQPLATRLGRAIRIGAPLLPSIAYCAWVYQRQRTGWFHNYEYQSAEGHDVFALVKVKEFFSYATGLRLDALDAQVLTISVGFLLISALLRDVEETSMPALRWLFISSVLAYLVISHVFWATNFVFQRVSILILLTAIVWVPKASSRYQSGLDWLHCAAGLMGALTFFTAMNKARTELSALDIILNEMPKQRKVIGLIWKPRIESFAQPVLLHMPAYYVARNGGEVAFSFTRTMSLPVHYRRETMPPALPYSFEWNPTFYKPHEAYAKYFDLVLLKTPNALRGDPRKAIWGKEADHVDVVAQQGSWWVFDTQKLHAAYEPDPSDIELIDQHDEQP